MVNLFESKLWISVVQNCGYYLVSNFVKNVEQTSTPVWEFGRVLVETSTELRQPGVEVCSKFARYINKAHCEITVFDEIPTRLRPNFYQTSTPPVSKSGRNSDQTSTKLRHLGINVWSNCWYVLFKIVNICWPESCIIVDHICGYLFVHIMNNVWSKLLICVCQNCGGLLVNIVYICWSQLWIIVVKIVNIALIEIVNTFWKLIFVWYDY